MILLEMWLNIRKGLFSSEVSLPKLKELEK